MEKVYESIEKMTKIIKQNMILTYAARFMGVMLAFLMIGSFHLQSAPTHTLAQQTGKNHFYFPVVFQSLVQNGPVVYTTSFYMATVDTNELYRRGCELGQRDLGLAGTQDNLVVLDFGGPRNLGNGVFGARLFTTALWVSTNQIASAVEWFGLGYYVCTGTDIESDLVIGIGTNNYTDDGTPLYAVTYEHGAAWANMVNQVNQWFVENGYSRQVSAVGANDIELSWNDYGPTKAWLDGYESTNHYEMINFGALPGCPYFRSPGAQCGSYPYIWTKEQAWYVTWGAASVYPLPEIYANSGVNAEQWYLMSVYAYQAHGLAMEFRGVMTQWQACQVRHDSACNVLDNTPLEGYNQLSGLVNGNPNTAHRIRWSTDITW
jgi:hypothetical protein